MSEKIPGAPELMLANIRSLTGWVDGNFPSDDRRLLETILETVVEPKFPGALIPALVEESGSRQMVYYAVAPDDTQWKNLQPLISASVGITYSDFTGIKKEVDPQSALERIIQSSGYTIISRFGSRSETDLGKTLALNLHRLVENIKERPDMPNLILKTPAQMVAEFDWALGYRKRDECARILREIRDRSSLDAVNLLFLQTRMHATFNEWSELFEAPFFQDLILMRRPPMISLDLVEAVYKTRFSGYERSADAQGAVNDFKTNIVDSTGDNLDRLFDRLPVNTIPGPDVVKSFMIGELAQKNPDLTELNRLHSMSEDWLATDRNFLDLLMSLAPSSANTTEAGDPLSTAKLRLLDAWIEKTEESKKLAQQAIDNLTDAERTELFSQPRIIELWEEMTSVSTDNSQPTSWEEWIDIAVNSEFKEYRQLAATLVKSRPISENLQTKADVDHLVKRLEILSTDEVQVVSQVLPIMVDWIKADEDWPNSNYRSLYQHLLLFLLLYAETKGQEILVATADLLTSLLTLNIDAEVYSQTLEDLAGALESLVAASDIDWLIDIAELTLANPVKNENACEEFLGSVAARFNALKTWATADQRDLLRSLLQIVGLEDSIEANTEQMGGIESTVKTISAHGLSVGIYTLTPQVGERASENLMAKFDGVSVNINDDKQNTAKLSALAESADLFVICFSSAKHAATTSVMDIRRSKGLKTVYATGTSSIIRVVSEYIEGELQQAA